MVLSLQSVSHPALPFVPNQTLYLLCRGCRYSRCNAASHLKGSSLCNKAGIMQLCQVNDLEILLCRQPWFDHDLIQQWVTWHVIVLVCATKGDFILIFEVWHARLHLKQDYIQAIFFQLIYLRGEIIVLINVLMYKYVYYWRIETCGSPSTLN